MSKMARQDHQVKMETKVKKEILVNLEAVEGTERLDQMGLREKKERRVIQADADRTDLVVLQDPLAHPVILSNAEIAPRTSRPIVGSALQIHLMIHLLLRMPKKTIKQLTLKRIRIRLVIRRTTRNRLLLLQRSPLRSRNLQTQPRMMLLPRRRTRRRMIRRRMTRRRMTRRRMTRTLTRRTRRRTERRIMERALPCMIFLESKPLCVPTRRRML